MPDFFQTADNLKLTEENCKNMFLNFCKKNGVKVYKNDSFSTIFEDQKDFLKLKTIIDSPIFLENLQLFINNLGFKDKISAKEKLKNLYSE